MNCVLVGSNLSLAMTANIKSHKQFRGQTPHMQWTHNNCKSSKLPAATQNARINCLGQMYFPPWPAAELASKEWRVVPSIGTALLARAKPQVESVISWMTVPSGHFCLQWIKFNFSRKPIQSFRSFKLNNRHVESFSLLSAIGLSTLIIIGLLLNTKLLLSFYIIHYNTLYYTTFKSAKYVSARICIERRQLLTMLNPWIKTKSFFCTRTSAF